jgi:hypothetical protein
MGGRQSQRDCIIQPKVARDRYLGFPHRKYSYPERVASSTAIGLNLILIFSCPAAALAHSK